MNNTEPLNIQQDPNMLDDVVRFYESQITQDEQDWIRSPFLSTFTVNRNIPAGTLWTLLPSYTENVDSYISLDMEPERTTQRTTDLISDWFETRKWYRALKSWWYIIEFNGNCTGNLNWTYWLRLWEYWQWRDDTKAITWQRIIINGWILSTIDETNYRAILYLKWWEYFLFQLYVNWYNSAPSYTNIAWSSNIVWKLKVFCIEDKYITWQTLSQ